MEKVLLWSMDNLVALSNVKALHALFVKRSEERFQLYFKKTSWFVLFCTGVTEREISNLQDIFLGFNIHKNDMPEDELFDLLQYNNLKNLTNQAI